MWWNSGPHLRRRVRLEAGEHKGQARQNVSFFSAESDVEEFKKVLQTKFGSVTRAWRVGLDADDNGMLDFKEFIEATRHIGYVGNLRTLWFNLDRDGSGAISLKELDPSAAHDLDKFRFRCTSKFGSMEACWQKRLDKDRSGFVQIEEFEAFAGEIGYDDPDEVEELFHLLLVRPGATSLQYQDVDFLQKWEETKREQYFRKRLPVRWVNRDPAFFGKATLPSTPASDKSPDYENSVSLDHNQMREDFRRFLVQKYGSLCHAFDMMDANGSGSLSMVEFQSVVASVLQYCRPADARRLFMSFNDDPGAMLTWDELGISSQEWINHIMKKRNRDRVLEVQRQEALAAPLGGTARELSAVDKHANRIKFPPLEKKDVAFGRPLPQGWGAPPTFKPQDTTRKAGTLTSSLSLSLDSSSPRLPMSARF